MIIWISNYYDWYVIMDHSCLGFVIIVPLILEGLETQLTSKIEWAGVKQSYHDITSHLPDVFPLKLSRLQICSM